MLEPAYNYYFRFELADGEVQITTCKNLLFQEGQFTVSIEKRVEIAEIWNYDSQKKVGELKFLKFPLKSAYQHIFHSSNL